MTEASAYLVQLARTCAEPYVAHASAQAVLLSGSAAEGISDYYSDIDMMVYYNELPSEEFLAAARETNGGGERLWQLGDRAGGAVVEAYQVKGVEVQIVHTTIDSWKAQMAEILVKHQVDSPLQKAMSGTLRGIALHGSSLIEEWKADIRNYPDELREKMVAANLQFFPVWRMGERFFARDANLWFHQIRVETLQKLMGLLAGLNRVYFTTFQFKRMAEFVEQLTVAPIHLLERLEASLAAEPRAAALMLGDLVEETVDLVAREMPYVDLAPARKQLAREFTPWVIPDN